MGQILQKAAEIALHGAAVFRRSLAMACLAAIVMQGFAARAADDTYARHRARMVETISRYAALSQAAIERPRLLPRVLQVMNDVPRHEYLPMSKLPGIDWLQGLIGGDHPLSIAYEDRPVAIGFGQTMSQPFIVALMTDLLDPQPGHVVLEIGTGSGYQAAVLAPLVKRVCSIEIIPELGASSAAVLQRLGNHNVKTRVGDGYYGWEDCGPFDGIVVTAAAGHIPPPLVRQLKPGGRMVIPVGGPFSIQLLVLVQKDQEERVTTRQLLPVRFVPLVRELQ